MPIFLRIITIIYASQQTGWQVIIYGFTPVIFSLFRGATELYLYCVSIVKLWTELVIITLVMFCWIFLLTSWPDTSWHSRPHRLRTPGQRSQDRRQYRPGAPRQDTGRSSCLQTSLRSSPRASLCSHRNSWAAGSRSQPPPPPPPPPAYCWSCFAWPGKILHCLGFSGLHCLCCSVCCYHSC